MFPEPSREEIELTMSDKWILAELNKTLEDVRRLYDDFDFYAVNYVKRFTWSIFADHYIEMVKSRAYGSTGTESQQKAAWWTLHKVLKTILKILAPVTPFITDYIYRTLYNKTVHKEPFPEVEEYDKSLLNYTELVLGANAKIWKLKQQHKLALNAPVKKIWLPEDLKPFELDLKAMHVAKEIIFVNVPTSNVEEKLETIRIEV